MEGDRQLNHTLDVETEDVETEMATRRPVARQGAPNVFESFMSVEEMGAVEEVEASLEVLVVLAHAGPIVVAASQTLFTRACFKNAFRSDGASLRG